MKKQNEVKIIEVFFTDDHFHLSANLEVGRVNRPILKCEIFGEKKDLHKRTLYGLYIRSGFNLQQNLGLNRKFKTIHLSMNRKLM